jgi:hypothetical protein
MTRPTVCAALVVGSTFFSPGAIAVSPAVRSACANDFLAYCSQHDPDSRAARACMRAHGPNLSKVCLNALIAAGEVSKKEVARRERGEK